MTQGGKVTWWDTGPFEAVVPSGVSYECKEVLGAKGTLSARDCRDASFAFVNQGEGPRINMNAPIKYTRGECSSAMGRKLKG